MSGTNGTALSKRVPLLEPFARWVARDRQESVWCGPSLNRTWLDPIRALADGIRSNRTVKGRQERFLGSGFSQKERRAKSLDRLEGSRAAEGTRPAPLLGCGGGHHAPHQVVGYDAHPQLLPDHRRCFASDALHPQCRLDGPQITCRLPPTPREVRKVLLGAHRRPEEGRQEQQAARTQALPAHPYPQCASLP